MLLTSDVITWVEGLGLIPSGTPFFHGPDLPKQPGQHVVVTPYSGPGLNLEAVYDTRGFQFRVIGPQAAPYQASAEAEALAAQIDTAILSVGLNGPFQIGTTRVLYVTRSGSGFVPIPGDASQRPHYVGSYLFQAASGL